MSAIIDIAVNIAVIAVNVVVWLLLPPPPLLPLPMSLSIHAIYISLALCFLLSICDLCSLLSMLSLCSGSVLYALFSVVVALYLHLCLLSLSRSVFVFIAVYPHLSAFVPHILCQFAAGGTGARRTRRHRSGSGSRLLVGSRLSLLLTSRRSSRR